MINEKSPEFDKIILSWILHINTYNVKINTKKNHKFKNNIFLLPVLFNYTLLSWFRYRRLIEVLLYYLQTPQNICFLKLDILLTRVISIWYTRRVYYSIWIPKLSKLSVKKLIFQISLSDYKNYYNKHKIINIT